jgi:hypothetical protein
VDHAVLRALVAPIYQDPKWWEVLREREISGRLFQFGLPAGFSVTEASPMTDDQTMINACAAGDLTEWALCREMAPEDYTAILDRVISLPEARSKAVNEEYLDLAFERLPYATMIDYANRFLALDDCIEGMKRNAPRIVGEYYAATAVHAPVSRELPAPRRSFIGSAMRQIGHAVGIRDRKAPGSGRTVDH